MTQKQRRPSLRRSYLNSLAIATMSPAERVAALLAELVKLEASLSGAPGLATMSPADRVAATRVDEIVAGIARILADAADLEVKATGERT